MRLSARGLPATRLQSLARENFEFVVDVAGGIRLKAGTLRFDELADLANERLALGTEDVLPALLASFHLADGLGLKRVSRRLRATEVAEPLDGREQWLKVR
jgi:hypothetical protein